MDRNQIKTVVYVCRARSCEECGEDATMRLTFLFPHARTNPASKGYRGDDISWAADEEAFACYTHEHEVRKSYQREGNLEWCSTFQFSNFPHMGLYWSKDKEEIVTPDLLAPVKKEHADYGKECPECGGWERNHNANCAAVE
jgi:hypothetical protein